MGAIILSALRSFWSEYKIYTMYIMLNLREFLLQRLERLTSLQELRHMQERMQAQLGIRLEIGTSGSEVRTLRGVTVLVLPQPGLCRKTRQALPAAIKKSMEQHPEIVYALLNEGGLFSA